MLWAPRQALPRAHPPPGRPGAAPPSPRTLSARLWASSARGPFGSVCIETFFIGGVIVMHTARPLGSGDTAPSSSSSSCHAACRGCSWGRPQPFGRFVWRPVVGGLGHSGSVGGSRRQSSAPAVHTARPPENCPSSSSSSSSSSGPNPLADLFGDRWSVGWGTRGGKRQSGRAAEPPAVAHGTWTPPGHAHPS